ncbi:hypothetical protein [Coleofasciculus sp. H7-2]|uniref:hypothetical protein n=1 Tax=Coleofasciculus sp. H7-2 TaxID=3351545 RepID=UPI00366D9380
MSDTPKVKMQFHATVTGVVGNVEGDFVIYPRPESPAEAAAEIQELLNQLQQSNSKDIEGAIQRETERNLAFKIRLKNALRAAGLETAKVFFAPLGIGIEAVRGWLEAE